MTELAIPDVNNPTSFPSTTENGIGATIDLANGTTNGHGPGYDGMSSTNGHANGGQKPVTIAVVGAGQRGQVDHTHCTSGSLADPRSTQAMHLNIPNYARW
jgi:hypothetical protein